MSAKKVAVLAVVATFAAVALAVGASGGSAQQRLDARGVGSAVQRYYDQSTVFSADFNQTYFNKLYGSYQRSNGRVFFKKPGKMRWDYAAPNGKIIVSDGTRIQYFEPGEAGQSGQMHEMPMRDSQLTGALSFLTGTGRLADQFTFRLLDARQQGYPAGYVLELTPRQATPHYERILLFVDATPAALGVVHRVLILDSAGNRNRFDFRRMSWATTSVRDEQFRWTPPRGTRRIAQ